MLQASTAFARNSYCIQTGISATPACGERHLVLAIIITHYIPVLLKYMLSIKRLA